jgi:hypothetical protein
MKKIMIQISCEEQNRRVVIITGVVLDLGSVEIS